jgi:hypothetical protein
VSTFTQIRTAVAEELGMDTTDDATKLNRWINDAVRDFLLETSCNVDKANISLTSGTADYTMSTSILRILKVYAADASQSRVLERLPLDDLIDRQTLNSTVTYPAKYYATKGRSIFLYPTPGSNETLKLVYVPRPTELSGDSDDPSTISLGGIPVEHHVALEYYTMARAAGYDDDVSSGGGNAYWNLYQREIVRARRNMRRNGGGRNPRVVVGSRRNRWGTTSDNSVGF